MSIYIMALPKVAAFVAISLTILALSEALSVVQEIRTDATNETTTPKPPRNSFQLELKGFRCRDTYRRCTQEMCDKHKRCTHDRCVKYTLRRIKRACKKTCGYCRALSPPACFSSPYGCCWDYLTSALGPYGKGCPPCSDSRRYPHVCLRFKTYCLRKGISGRWMRGHCPDACGHCDIWQF